MPYCVMHIRSLLVTLCLLPLLGAVAQGQTSRRIIAGKSPAFLFADEARGHVHVITAGIDQNFNGVLELDSGDVAPQWFVVNAVTETIVNSTAFDSFFSSYPIRLGADLQGGRLYAAQLGRVRAYDIATLTVARDTVVLGNFGAVSFDEQNGLLMLAEPIGFADPGYIHMVNPTTGVTVAIVRSGIGPSMSASVKNTAAGRTEYYSIAEGTFGTSNSTISYASMQHDVYRAANGQALGGGGSYLATRGTNAFFVLGGGQRIHAVDTRTGKDLSYSPISTGAIGPNGPRSLGFQSDDVLLVGMSLGKVLRVRIDNGELIDTIEVRGRVESIAVRDSLGFFAIRSNEGGVDSVVFVANLNTGDVVDTLFPGVEPTEVFVAANGDIHVIGAISGANAWWWTVYNGATLAVASSDTFSGYLDVPLRTFYDATSDALYLVVSDSLRAYSAASPTSAPRFLYNDKFDSTKLSGVSGGNGYLLVHEIGAVANPGPEYLHVLNTEGTLMAKFQTGSRPTMAAGIRTTRDNALAFYVLDRGTPTQIDQFEFQPNILGSDTLGNGANHLAVNGMQGLVTMNGGHELVGVDFEAWKAALRIPTGTSGWDGPRESLSIGLHLLVTTYAGDVRMFTSPTEYKTFPMGGKAEGITAVAGKVFVASAFLPDYSVDSAVVVFDTTLLVASVERTSDVAAAAALEQNYPNPVVDATTIRFAVPASMQVTLTVYTADGRKVETLINEQMESGSYAAEVRTGGLPSGSYIYTLQAGTSILSRTMRVVR